MPWARTRAQKIRAAVPELLQRVVRKHDSALRPECAPPRQMRAAQPCKRGSRLHQKRFAGRACALRGGSRLYRDKQALSSVPDCAAAEQRVISPAGYFLRKALHPILVDPLRRRIAKRGKRTAQRVGRVFRCTGIRRRLRHEAYRQRRFQLHDQQRRGRSKPDAQPVRAALQLRCRVLQGKPRGICLLRQPSQLKRPDG